MATQPTKIPTRIMIISDTHNFEFGKHPAAPLSLSNIPSDIDILLHCGDLTNTGELSEYRGALQMLKEIPAKLKLVIAGNHDRTLDIDWIFRKAAPSRDPRQQRDSAKVFGEAVKIMSKEAKEVGVTYLKEGLSDFALDNGAALRIYTSPYTPEFGGWGWAYERDEDRFNGAAERELGMKGVDLAKRIPSFAEGKDGRNIDIVMTHGPPQNILDKVDGPGGHVGCFSLLRALGRAKPTLFCCGHIHEGHGAEVATWEGQGVFRTRKVECNWPNLNRETIEGGRETLMVNASIMNVEYQPTNKPWYIELDLPAAMNELRSPN
ncbi:hypothetical protein DSL72_005234 [Monilinia vaccinii-corymbosi]|uniref:Calcineurin-like phosphoesterase domain-containing protein n=1 Tax=Monilinia vaccinii-corymbosi TaxID=61207 RepID=A0A8A3PF48_9HELO|nr:hypothetical protein DSL72_005234 [Monilinia vaccinii-corymbosi]